MIDDTIYPHWLTLVNHFNMLGTAYRGMALSMYGQPGLHLSGMIAAFHYEGDERWKMSKHICTKLKRANKAVNIGPVAAPKQDFKSVQEILNYACSLEDQTLTTIKGFVKNAKDVDDIYSYKCLTDVYMWCVKEYEEIAGLSKMFKMCSGDTCALAMKDKELYAKYYVQDEHDTN